MVDYVPVFIPSRVISLTASGTISGGDLLMVSGSGTVAKMAFAASPVLNVIGVAGHDAINGGRVTVYARGYVHESVAQGTVTAGDQVTTPVTGDTAGAQVKTLPPLGGAPGQADVNAARGILGIALTTASNPNKVRWMEI